MTFDEARDWTSNAFAVAMGALQTVDFRAFVPWGETILVLILFVLWRRAARRVKDLDLANENLSAELGATMASLDSEIAWRKAAERLGVQRPKEPSENPPASATDQSNASNDE